MKVCVLFTTAEEEARCIQWCWYSHHEPIHVEHLNKCMKVTMSESGGSWKPKLNHRHTCLWHSVFILPVTMQATQETAWVMPFTIIYIFDKRRSLQAHLYSSISATDSQESTMSVSSNGTWIEQSSSRSSDSPAAPTVCHNKPVADLSEQSDLLTCLSNLICWLVWATSTATQIAQSPCHRLAGTLSQMKSIGYELANSLVTTQWFGLTVQEHKAWGRVASCGSEMLHTIVYAIDVDFTLEDKFPAAKCLGGRRPQDFHVANISWFPVLRLLHVLQ